MRRAIARNRVPIFLAAAVLAAALAYIPTPYSLVVPGEPVDLSRAIEVGGRRPPSTHFFLTDVRFAPHFSAMSLLAAWAPGAEILPSRPAAARTLGPREYLGLMRADMDQSQTLAAIVAERAARLPVPALRASLVVVGFPAHSQAAGWFRPGQSILSVDGKRVVTAFEVRRLLARRRAGQSADVVLGDGGKRVHERVRLVTFQGRTVLGVFLTTIVSQPKLPVSVRYRLEGVGGSSGGLMFALDIYQALRPPRSKRFERVAGTGTIAFDGAVGPIEGTRQKLAAARSAGATLFFVPRENFADVANARGIRVIPVGTFADALAALGS